MITLYLVRHGENIANITKEFSYKIIDYNLTEKGHQQASQTAQYFENIEIDRIFSSPLKRAIQTAQHIANTKKIAINILENFRELNVGDLEKIGPNDATWKTYFSVTAAWYKGDTQVSFPNGENCLDVINRFYQGVLEAVGNDTNASILIVGHGGIFTASILELCKIKDRDNFTRLKNENCSISKVMVNKKNDKFEFDLVSWAVSSHIVGNASLFTNSLPAINENKGVQ